MALHREGWGQRAIARQLRIRRNTVQRSVCSPGFPERAEGTGRRAKGASKLERYLPYLREQWDAGIHNGSRLFDEVKARGYTGCQSGLRKRLGSRGGQSCHPGGGQGIHPNRLSSRHLGQRRLSSRSASFLMIVPPEKLTAKQHQQLESICQASSDLHTIYLLCQQFVTMLKQRRAETLNEWLKRAKESHVAELGSFANGILRDYAAVYAACSRPERNGGTAGPVNRLKFLKRQMFGRARLDVLRVKVLPAV